MPAIRPKIWLLLAALVLLAGCGEESTASGLPAATELDRLSPDRPVVLAFTADNCPYCEYVKEEHLTPMHDRGEAVTIREVKVSGDATITDFSGDPVQPRELADGYGLQVTPTLVFLTPEGETAAESLIGVSSRDFYGTYLDQRIESVREAMAADDE